jgi:hypothetical protein
LLLQLLATATAGTAAAGTAGTAAAAAAAVAAAVVLQLLLLLVLQLQQLLLLELLVAAAVAAAGTTGSKALLWRFALRWSYVSARSSCRGTGSEQEAAVLPGPLAAPPPLPRPSASDELLLAPAPWPAVWPPQEPFVCVLCCWKNKKAGLRFVLQLHPGVPTEEIERKSTKKRSELIRQVNEALHTSRVITG